LHILYVCVCVCVCVCVYMCVCVSGSGWCTSTGAYAGYDSDAVYDVCVYVCGYVCACMCVLNIFEMKERSVESSQMSEHISPLNAMKVE